MGHTALHRGLLASTSGMALLAKGPTNPAEQSMHPQSCLWLSQEGQVCVAQVRTVLLQMPPGPETGI